MEAESRVDAIGRRTECIAPTESRECNSRRRAHGAHGDRTLEGSEHGGAVWWVQRADCDGELRSVSISDHSESTCASVLSASVLGPPGVQPARICIRSSVSTCQTCATHTPQTVSHEPDQTRSHWDRAMSAQSQTHTVTVALTQTSQT